MISADRDNAVFSEEKTRRKYGSWLNLLTLELTLYIYYFFEILTMIGGFDNIPHCSFHVIKKGEQKCYHRKYYD